MKEKILSIYKKIKKTLAPYKKNIIMPLLEIIGIIIVCALIVRFMGGHETLAQYAEKNPDIAYQSSVEENIVSDNPTDN
ncbi:MAG: hypothetical protein MJ107_07060 [Lachnospiraceae bacterium]|nr:hypothetical protein [Lachnospiraceae bacterium]